MAPPRGDGPQHATTVEQMHITLSPQCQWAVGPEVGCGLRPARMRSSRSVMHTSQSHHSAAHLSHTAGRHSPCPWIEFLATHVSIWSQSDSSRRTGETEPWSPCGSSSPLLFGVALIRRSFHASPQRPARRRPPPTPPAIGPMSMALSGEVDGEGGEGNGEGDSEVSSKELTFMK